MNQINKHNSNSNSNQQSTHIEDKNESCTAKVGLAQFVEELVKDYFVALDGETTTDLYELIIHQVEKPLIQVVLSETNGNKSKSAEILGLNRGTLRKKLKQYDL